MALLLKSYHSLMMDTYSRITSGIFWDKKLKLYSKKFIRKILYYFESQEDYEKCIIIKQILHTRFNHELNYKTKNTMNYVKELQPISDFPENFLKDLNFFFINSNLSSQQRNKLVEIIKENSYSANFKINSLQCNNNDPKSNANSAT